MKIIEAIIFTLCFSALIALVVGGIIGISHPQDDNWNVDEPDDFNEL